MGCVRKYLLVSVFDMCKRKKREKKEKNANAWKLAPLKTANNWKGKEVWKNRICDVTSHT